MASKRKSRVTKALIDHFCKNYTLRVARHLATRHRNPHRLLLELDPQWYLFYGVAVRTVNPYGFFTYSYTKDNGTDCYECAVCGRNVPKHMREKHITGSCSGLKGLWANCDTFELFVDLVRGSYGLAIDTDHVKYELEKAKVRAYYNNKRPKDFRTKLDRYADNIGRAIVYGWYSAVQSGYVDEHYEVGHIPWLTNTR